MPVVTGFQPLDTSDGKLQPTQLVAKYKVFSRDGHDPVFQVDTGGSEHRKYPGKGSQTFQLNKASAEELWRLLGQTYGFK